MQALLSLARLDDLNDELVAVVGFGSERPLDFPGRHVVTRTIGATRADLNRPRDIDDVLLAIRCAVREGYSPAAVVIGGRVSHKDKSAGLLLPQFDEVCERRNFGRPSLIIEANEDVNPGLSLCRGVERVELPPRRREG